MALAPASVATSIAAVSISGVTVKDLTGIKDELFNRDCPVLMPSPADFITGLSIERESYGADSVAFKYVRYTFNYEFFYCEAGTGRGIYDHFQALVTAWGTVLDAFIANSTISNSAVIDAYPTAADIGIVTDPTGKEFFGFRFALGILEWVNKTT
jgi:hypothetical protein